MNLNLAEIRSQVTPGAHAVQTVNRAGWHQGGGKPRIPLNISLLTLPPYSPELNPVENIRQFLRQNFLANRLFDLRRHRGCLLYRLQPTHRRPAMHPLHRNQIMGSSGQRVGRRVSECRWRA